MTSEPESMEDILADLFVDGRRERLFLEDAVARAAIRLAALAQPKDEEGGQTVDAGLDRSGAGGAPSSGDLTELQQAQVDVGFWSNEAEKLLDLINGGVVCDGETWPLVIADDDQGNRWLALEDDGAARVQITPPQSNGLNPDLSSPLAKEAEGWKLVPVEPTPEMLANVRRDQIARREFDRAMGGSDQCAPDDAQVYRAMLAAVERAE